MQANDPPRRLGFGVFEVDLRDRQLTKRGLRIRLQEQPFQLLAMLLERPGEVVTRDELRNRLWPNAVVDFDHGLNKAPAANTAAPGWDLPSAASCRTFSAAKSSCAVRPTWAAAGGRCLGGKQSSDHTRTD
jgi:hypothetical protein